MPPLFPQDHSYPGSLTLVSGRWPLGVDFSPALAAGAGSSSPWTRPAAHVGCHSALGTRGHLGRESSEESVPYCELGDPERGTLRQRNRTR